MSFKQTGKEDSKYCVQVSFSDMKDLAFHYYDDLATANRCFNMYSVEEFTDSVLLTRRDDDDLEVYHVLRSYRNFCLTY